VTSEDDFHAALDANPHDWQTRLVFADWLEERCDTRAEGYRALARGGFVPELSEAGPRNGTHGMWSFGHDRNPNPHYKKSELLPHDWYRKLAPMNQYENWKPTAWAYFHSRRIAEDAAARAFAKLSAERRAALTAPG